MKLFAIVFLTALAAHAKGPEVDTSVEDKRVPHVQASPSQVRAQRESMANFNATLQDARSFADQEMYRTYESMRSWAPSPTSEKHLRTLHENLRRDREQLREAFRTESDYDRKRIYAQRIRAINDTLNEDSDVAATRARAVR